VYDLRIIKDLYPSLHNTHLISSSIFEIRNLFERYLNFISYQTVNTLPVNSKNQYVMKTLVFILGTLASKAANFKDSKL
jgi:hypothetical protein